MISVIKRPAICFLRCLQGIRWNLQYRKCKKQGLFYNNASTISYAELGKVLVVAPHADDEWIGCYTILTNTIKPTVFYCGFYGNDYSERNIFVRKTEIEKCSQHNNFQLKYANIENRQESLDHVIQEGYDSIFIPSPFDWHPEHRLTYKIAYEVINNLKTVNVAIPVVYCYQISVPHRKYESLFISEMGIKSQRNKWNIFEDIYISQKMPVHRYILQERLNAASSDNYYAAEVFSKPNEEEQYSDYILACNTENLELDAYRLVVDDIYAIREVSNKTVV